jgi:hypothetical protein
MLLAESRTSSDLFNAPRQARRCASKLAPTKKELRGEPKKLSSGRADGRNCGSGLTVIRLGKNPAIDWAMRKPQFPVKALSVSHSSDRGAARSCIGRRARHAPPGSLLPRVLAEEKPLSPSGVRPSALANRPGIIRPESHLTSPPCEAAAGPPPTFLARSHHCGAEVEGSEGFCADSAARPAIHLTPPLPVDPRAAPSCAFSPLGCPQSVPNGKDSSLRPRVEGCSGMQPR